MKNGEPRTENFIPHSRFSVPHWAFPFGLSVSSVSLWLDFFTRPVMKTVRIGNGCGFWGDNLDAPVLLAEQGELDYLTLEYLAELTMSILALQKQRDPKAGFATDFLDVLERLGPALKSQPNLKIITNAGGMQPAACAAQ